MKSNPSVKEQIREVLDKVASRHMKGNPYYYIDQAQEAILKIIESEVIQARQNEWDYVFDFFDTAQDEARDHFRAMYNDLKQDRA